MKTALTTLLAMLLATGSLVAEEKPNIVLFMADDQDHSVIASE